MKIHSPPALPFVANIQRPFWHYCWFCCRVQCPYLVWLSKEKGKHSAAILFDRPVLIPVGSYHFQADQGITRLPKLKQQACLQCQASYKERSDSFYFWLSRHYSLTASELVLLWSFATFSQGEGCGFFNFHCKIDCYCHHRRRNVCML